MKKEIFYVSHFTGETLHLLVINSKDFSKVERKYKKLGCKLEPAPSYLMYENDTDFTIVEE